MQGPMAELTWPHVTVASEEVAAASSTAAATTAVATTSCPRAASHVVGLCLLALAE